MIVGGDSATHDPVVIEVALNGGRGRDEHSDVPLTPGEVAVDAVACLAAGATVAHIHARSIDGRWSADPAWYAEAIGEIRTRAPGMIVSLTSIRPERQPVERVTDMLDQLAADTATRPDAISINLGHIAVWERRDGGWRTVHYPNANEDIVAVLRRCRRHGILPELGIMDLGFVSNAVALAADGELPERPWREHWGRASRRRGGPRTGRGRLRSSRPRSRRASTPASAWRTRSTGRTGARWATSTRSVGRSTHRGEPVDRWSRSIK